jgi:alkylated DNA repair dioxygenase AlkB
VLSFKMEKCYQKDRIGKMNTPPITLINNWLDPAQSGLLFTDLLASIDWQTEAIKMFGKSIIVPRKIAWYGDDDATYRYSGITHQPLPWIPIIQHLRLRINEEHDLTFNSVLCNLYTDGSDYMGWHRDNEPELGSDPIIASVSLGEPRRFIFRHILSGERHEIMLQPGSLLLMRKGCQHEWKHSLPKTKNVKNPRINLTFRRVRV